MAQADSLASRCCKFVWPRVSQREKVLLQAHVKVHLRLCYLHHGSPEGMIILMLANHLLPSRSILLLPWAFQS